MIKKILLCLVCLTACSTDPILPGTRTAVFQGQKLTVLDTLPIDIGQPIASSTCEEYSIDKNNIIWKGNKRIFNGFPTDITIDAQKKVICKNGFVYAGLSTGELVKVQTETGEVKWTADIFPESEPTNISLFLDIVAEPVYLKGFIYVGGLNNSFCKIKDSTGKKVWCLPISTQKVVKATNKFIFIETTDAQNYAVSIDGKVYKVNEDRL